MKKVFLIIATTILGSALITSCKKNSPAPEIRTETITNTNTVTVHDTTYVVGQDLIGIWNVYKSETVLGSSSSFSSLNYKFNFTTTTLYQDLGNDGTFEYNYPVTYGTSYVDVFYSASPTTYAISTAGKEYRLSTVNGGGQTVIWYLKK